jgi:hypothetical protein
MNGTLAGLNLDNSIYKDLAQWDTFQKQMSTITNFSQAAVGGLKDSVGAYEQKCLKTLRAKS